VKKALVALALAGGLACGDDPTGPPNPRGDYELTSFNGAAIPAAVSIPTQDPGITITSITGGSLILREDDTFVMSVLIRVTSGSTTGPGVINFGNGTYTFTETEVRLTRDNIPVNATIGSSGGARTITVPLGGTLGTLMFTESE
jgi:hypothetical protein